MNSAPSSDKTLFEIFKDIALKYPDRIALDFMGSGMTYKKILHKIVRTATAFHSHGIREGDCVAICAPNCPQAIVSIYALSSIGACAVMTNPLSPPNQLVAQLRETGCKAVIILDLILPKIRKYFIKKRKDGSANVLLDNLKTVLHFNLPEEMP
ncbi:MAG: AMP-binding protein, partial [Eubacteriales bacterium]|nr:AMP-binding protein [Eubacteriales bacterium]